MNILFPIKLLSSACLAILVACSSPSPTNIYEDSADSTIDNAISISKLKSYYLGSTHQIIDDVTISARVVANDMFGELEGRIVLQDDSGGIEIYIDEDNIYDSYQLYSYITISCSGLWLASRGGSNGAVVMGAYPTAYDPVDGLTSTQLSSRIIEYKTSSEAFNYGSCTLSEVSTELISSCVIMESLSFVNVDSGDTLFDYDQYEEFGYCRRTMECQLTNLTIDLYIPDTITYPDMPIFAIEDSNGEYLVLIDRYASNYSIQLIGMGGF